MRKNTSREYMFQKVKHVLMIARRNSKGKLGLEMRERKRKWKIHPHMVLLNVISLCPNIGC